MVVAFQYHAVDLVVGGEGLVSTVPKTSVLRHRMGAQRIVVAKTTESVNQRNGDLRCWMTAEN